MKRYRLWLCVSLLALAVPAAAAVSAQITYITNPEVPVPDLTTSCSAMVVPDSIVISDLNVLLRASHTFVSDVAISIKSPAGTSVTLFNHNDGSGDNFGGGVGSYTVFDDQAVTAISAGAPPYIGSFKPASLLSAFNGQNVSGRWELTWDDTVGGDSGTLHTWGLQVNSGDSLTTLPALPCLSGSHHVQHTTHGHRSVLHHGVHGHTVGPQDPPHAFGHKPGLTADDSGGVDVPPVMLAARNEDGSLNANSRIPALAETLSRAAPRGTVVQLFGPAAGITLEDPVVGEADLITAPAEGGRLYRTRSLPLVLIGGIQAEVLYSGLAPGLTGVWQINVRIPGEAPAGRAVPAAITYEDRPLARKVAIAIE
jgi:subtilisin-like proprotein convertase family protein